MFQHRDVDEEAEAAACLEGIPLATRWPDTPMILEADCHSVVVKRREAQEQEARPLAGVAAHPESTQESQKLQSLRVVKVGRAQNEVCSCGLPQLAVRGYSATPN